MTLALLLAVMQAPPQAPALVDIHDLSPQEYRVSAFILSAPQPLTISAVAAEPWPDRLRDRDERHWQDDQQTTWPAAAWILDARTRAVVWHIRSAETRRESNGLRHFDGTIRLPAGTYEAHYASYPSAFANLNLDIKDFRDIVRLGRRAKYGGPYVETGLYKQFGITITGAGRNASDDELKAAHGAFTASAIVTVVPDRNSSARKGFEITRPTNIEVYAIGELTLDDEFDYGWIMNADPAARASVKPFEYQPVPQGQTIVSLTEIGNDAMRSAGFALRRPMNVHIYALGEGTRDKMSDYAWIVDEEQHKRVWSMRYEDTEHAGGAEKNRLFDGTVHLDPGNYLVYYHSDGSHSYNDWNGSPPAEERYWGVSVFPASGRLNPADIGPFMRTRGAGTDAAVAQLEHMGNDEDARTPFRLTEETRLRVLAEGEGRDEDMFDYGWIEDDGGRTVWKMQYAATDPAGGADKNRLFDGVITLPAGAYVLRYHSDGSHSYNDWNDDAPDDPESWGISVFRTARR